MDVVGSDTTTVDTAWIVEALARESCEIAGDTSTPIHCCGCYDGDQIEVTLHTRIQQVKGDKDYSHNFHWQPN